MSLYDHLRYPTRQQMRQEIERLNKIRNAEQAVIVAASCLMKYADSLEGKCASELRLALDRLKALKEKGS